MKKRLHFVLIAFALNMLFVTLSYAATYEADPKGGTISGRVMDASSNKPMEYVNIAVFQASDSSLVTGTISTPDGQFRIEKLTGGEYYLRLTFLGFNNLIIKKIVVSAAKPQNELGDLKMAINSAELSGVAIVAERKKVEYQIDKRVINVGQDLIAKGGTAVDVLENTPSVQVDGQGNVTLRGSSDFVVLVDGKPSVMKGSDILKTISASSIKQIEVITNPSARYEADGTAGIINIIQKKERIQGVSGTANLSLGTRNKYTGSAFINYRKNKFNVFAGVDVSQNDYLSSLTMENITVLEEGNKYLNNHIERYQNNSGITGKVGFDYDLNEKNTFSFSQSYGKQSYDNGSHSIYETSFDNSELKSYYSSDSDMDVDGTELGLNMNYTHKFGENHSLTITNTYTSWDGYDDCLVSEYNTNPVYENPGINSSLTYSKDNFNYQYRLNVDYKRPIHTAKIEAGFQYRYEDRVDDFVFENLNVENGVWQINNMFTYNLDYVNDIYSGYATFSDEKAGFGYMLGVRSEYFNREIEFSNDADAHKYSKFMLYPSLHLTKSFKEKHNFQFSYSRRINRPTPYSLNITPIYIDPFTVVKGNPDLEPEYTDAFELNYRTSYKILTFNVQTYLRNTSNSFQQRYNVLSNGIMEIESFNANRKQAYGAELGLDFNLTKWWQLSSAANLYHFAINSVADSSQSTRNTNTWDARLISNFTLKWGTRIQLLGYYRAPNIDAQGEMTSMYIANIGLSQSFIKNKLNIGLSANNILNSVKFNYTSSGTNYNNKIKVQNEGMVVKITASYSFNNFQQKQRGRADDASFGSGSTF